MTVGGALAHGVCWAYLPLRTLNWMVIVHQKCLTHNEQYTFPPLFLGFFRR